MKAIYKYALETTDEQIVAMPKGAEILCIQIQRGRPCLWAMIDRQHKLADRHLRTIGTGHDIPVTSDMNYIGTYQLHEGALVFHVFDCGESDT